MPSAVEVECEDVQDPDSIQDFTTGDVSVVVVTPRLLRDVETDLEVASKPGHCNRSNTLDVGILELVETETVV